MDNQRRLFLGLAANSALISSSSLANAANEENHNWYMVAQDDDIQKILDSGKKLIILDPTILYKWNNTNRITTKKYW